MNQSDAVMRPLLRDSQQWRSSRVVAEEAMPGKSTWAYVPVNGLVESQAYQWGRIMRRGAALHQWTVEEEDLAWDWADPDRIALVPMCGTWHWPMGMNIPVLKAIQQTRNSIEAIEEGREFNPLSNTSDFALVRAIRGNSYQAYREYKQPVRWGKSRCLLIITRDGVPVIESDPVKTLEPFTL